MDGLAEPDEPDAVARRDKLKEKLVAKRLALSAFGAEPRQQSIVLAAKGGSRRAAGQGADVKLPARGARDQDSAALEAHAEEAQDEDADDADDVCVLTLCDDGLVEDEEHERERERERDLKRERRERERREREERAREQERLQQARDEDARQLEVTGRLQLMQRRAAEGERRQHQQKRKKRASASESAESDPQRRKILLDAHTGALQRQLLAPGSAHRQPQQTPHGGGEQRQGRPRACGVAPAFPQRCPRGSARALTAEEVVRCCWQTLAASGVLSWPPALPACTVQASSHSAAGPGWLAYRLLHTPISC